MNFMSKRVIILVLLFLTSCGADREERARLMSDELIKNLANKGSESYFDTAFFNREQMTGILKSVREKCDYKNREGGFINAFTRRSLGTKESNVFFLYEFHLSCDSVRFVLNYQLSDPPKLVGFKVEPTETKNFMIIR